MADKKKPARFRGLARTCSICGAQFVFAFTVATERTKRGAGGKWMPIDIVPNPEGRIAVRDAGGRVLYARALAADESYDRTNEVLGTPHQATCGKQLVPEIEKFLQEQAGNQ